MLLAIKSFIYGLGLFLIILSFIGFFFSIKPPKINSAITPKDLGLDYEDVNFTTEDNLRLSGWFIPSSGNKTKKTIILLHGYPADKGNILPLNSFLAKDYNLLLFDFRYFGKSEGRYTTIGIKEIEDLKAAITFLKKRGIPEIGIWGFSMGGAAALMISHNIIPEIKTIVSESGYASLRDMIYVFYSPLSFFKYPLSWLTILWTKLFLQIDIDQKSPLNLVVKIKVPLLITHSQDDKTIPFNQAIKIRNALTGHKNASFHFYKKMAHGQLDNHHKELMQNFFAKHL